MPTLLLDDLKDLLSSGGVTTTIFCGYMPERPDEALLLEETGGMAPVRAMPSTTRAAGVGTGHVVAERPTVRIVRRSASYQRARAEMNFIWRFLDGAGDRDINGTRYQWIAALQSPYPMPRDEGNDRSLVAFNVMVAKAVSTATST